MHVILELQGTRDMLAVGAHALAENACSYLGIRNQQLVGRVVRDWLNNVVVHYSFATIFNKVPSLAQRVSWMSLAGAQNVHWYTKNGMGCRTRRFVVFVVLDVVFI